MLIYGKVRHKAPAYDHLHPFPVSLFVLLLDPYTPITSPFSAA